MKYLVSIILFIPLFCFGQADTEYTQLEQVDALKSGISNMAENTKTIKTTFHQEKFLSVLTNPIESDGQMVFKKPNDLKWEYSKPYEYIIYFNANEIVINDAGKVSVLDVSSSKAFLEINKIIINSVSGNILQEDQFSISYFENKSYYLAKMKPKATGLKDFIQLIEVYLDKGDFTVSKIKLIEDENDYTNIEFSEKRLNESIPDEEFQYK